MQSAAVGVAGEADTGGGFKADGGAISVCEELQVAKWL